MPPLLRRQMVRLAALSSGERFAFVRDSTSGQAAVLEGAVEQNPGPEGGVVIECLMPGARAGATERVEWSGCVYVMPLAS